MVFSDNLSQLSVAGHKEVFLRTLNRLRISISQANFFEFVPALLLLLLSAFYAGCKPRQLVRPTPQMDIESQFWLRVLLLDKATDCTIHINSPFSVSTLGPELRIETLLAHFDKLEGPSKVYVSAGKITLAGQTFNGNEIIICPSSPHIFSLNGDEYRGKLKLILTSDGNSIDAMNIVPLEPYLAGVVGAEMPDYWEPEALKAQAIIARTYCLYNKRRFGSNRKWDVKRTQANQVYRGINAESAQVWYAVNSTFGQVLTCRHHNGTEDIFPTYYSSVCGGHTENSQNVFGDSYGPLEGVTCPYCRDVAKLSLFFWPTVKFDKTTVTNRLHRKYPKLRELGEIKKIIPVERSNYGDIFRITRVKLVGSTGKSEILRGEDLRLTIDPTGRKIKSTVCQIIKWDEDWVFVAGRGWGHGVGMCQYGAQGMARQGKTAEQILSYYFPGSKILIIDY
jgi:stage II sporulation protein D